jgi:hypothetical protein
MKNKLSEFRLPPDGRTYITAIVDRCKELINCGIWGDLDILRFEAWLNRFHTEQERYFAACVLDNLIYRSKGQTVAMLEQLFQRVLPDLTRLDPTPIGPIDNLLHHLKSSRPDPGIRLVPAVKQSDPLTKSANEIARFMKRHLGLAEKLFIAPSQIDRSAKKGIKVFIFIDDFLGTGTQFSGLLRETGLDKRTESKLYLIYAPLVSHISGKKKLHDEAPTLRVRSVEELDASYGLFHKDSACFKDECNTCESAKVFYYKLLRKKGLQITRKLGYGQLELAYAFEHATPNNSLPILWYNESKNWSPLFSR